MDPRIEALIESFDEKSCIKLFTTHYTGRYKKLITDDIKKESMPHIINRCVEIGRTDIFEINCIKETDISEHVLNFARDQATIDYLLTNIVDLNKVSCLTQRNAMMVLNFLKTKILKFKVDPNRKLRNGAVFWHSFGDDVIIIGELYKFHSDENFTQKIDIDAQGERCQTFLHFTRDVVDAILPLKPRYDIKDDMGLTALEYRKIAHGHPYASLEEYIKEQETLSGIYKSKNDEILCVPVCVITEKNSHIKSLEARIREYETKYSVLRDIIGSSPSE